MASAVLFLPCHIMELMNLVTSVELYTGSAATSRFGICPFRGMCLLSLRPLGSVFRASLFAVGYAHCVQRPANYVVAHPGKIFNPASPDEHNRVLLQVVSHSRDISCDLNPIGQAHARYFAQRRIRFLGCLGVHPRAYTALLRARLQRRARGLVLGQRPALAN